MEQRRRITMAQRMKMHPVTKRRRIGHQDPQDRRNPGKKGKRGQAEGIRSKVSSRNARTAGIRKKPGRQKQTRPEKQRGSKRKGSAGSH